MKFAMLEFIARVPYQAWERVGYLVLARHRGRSAVATRVFDRIVTTRAEQDNEQWHLLILQDLVRRGGLAAAAVFRGTGHDVGVYEQADGLPQAARDQPVVDAPEDYVKVGAEHGHARSGANMMLKPSVAIGEAEERRAEPGPAGPGFPALPVAVPRRLLVETFSRDEARLLAREGIPVLKERNATA